MPERIKSRWRTTAGGLLSWAVPLVALLAAYVSLDYLRPRLFENYDKHREFWGGNPSEVFSHWLDVVLMSGGATIVAWFLCIEAFYRRSDQQLKIRHIYGALALLLLLNGVIAVVLDGKHGEGTVILAYPVFFLPILGASFYMLRRSAALLDWRPWRVVPLCLSSVLFHAGCQLYYEPSETGGPNWNIIPFWLANVGGAVVWAFVRSIRSGLFGRVRMRCLSVGRKPIVWGSTITIILAISLYAERVRKPRQTMAFTWLNELEASLTDSMVGEIKRDHTPNKADGQSSIPISPAAQKLLSDERIKGDNGLRIYIPLNQNDYLFLWANARFSYCDIRQLVREHTEEMDQSFIDALIADGGTHQTRLISVLWSPYMAGRVLKDQAGKVKAICVINAPQP